MGDWKEPDEGAYFSVDCWWGGGGYGRGCLGRVQQHEDVYCLRYFIDFDRSVEFASVAGTDRGILRRCFIGFRYRDTRSVRGGERIIGAACGLFGAGL